MIVVDFSQLAISTLMVELKGATDVEISLPLVRHMILNTLRSYKVKFGKEFGQMVIACDSRKYWRKDVFPNYKAGRKKAREDSGLDWVAIYAALNQVKSELDEFFPYPVIEVETAEADDVIASLVFWSQENELVESTGLFSDFDPQPMLVLSGDHDFIQLQRFPNVKQFMPIQKKWCKAELPADQHLAGHIILGDKGDGIPNIKSPDDTFVTGARQKPIKVADLVKWRAMKPDDYCTPEMKRNYQRNEKLIDLRNVPFAIQGAVVKSYLAQKDRNRSKLLNYFISHKLRNMMDCIQEF
jgi:hypothetical protein